MESAVTGLLILLGGVALGGVARLFLSVAMRFPLSSLFRKPSAEETKDRKESIAGLCFGISILVAVAAVFFAIYSAYFVKTGIRTEGVISAIRETKDEKGETRRTPVYRYSDTGGKAHEDAVNLKDGNEYKIGDKIPVRYLPGSPADSRVDLFEHHWFLPLFLLGLASGLGAAPGIISRLSKKNRPPHIRDSGAAS